MKNKAEKCIKIIIWILSSVIIGCLLNYYVTSEILATYFYGLASVYPILTIVVLIMQIIVIAGVIYMIYKKRLSSIYYGVKYNIIHRSDGNFFIWKK